MRKDNLKTRVLLFATMMAGLITTAILASCGDDDDKIDTDVSQVKYELTFNGDFHYFYIITATYEDFNGVSHSEKVDANEWSYREKVKGYHPSLKCKVTATLKPADQMPTSLDRANYNFTYHYSVYWYNEKTGAKSLNPINSEGQIKTSENVQEYLDSHPTITLLDFER